MKVIIYVFTHVYFYIQYQIIILILNWWSIKWQKKSMNFEINICFVFGLIIAYINDVKVKYKNIMQQLY